jgi:hypothetical protein
MYFNKHYPWKIKTTNGGYHETYTEQLNSCSRLGMLVSSLILTDKANKIYQTTSTIPLSNANGTRFAPVNSTLVDYSFKRVMLLLSRTAHTEFVAQIT